MDWMKDTRWLWNEWREVCRPRQPGAAPFALSSPRPPDAPRLLQVVFRKDGSFLAPAENCEREGNPQCRWYTEDEDTVKVIFGGAGVHTLSPSVDQTILTGSRDGDGDSVSATRV